MLNQDGKTGDCAKSLYAVLVFPARNIHRFHHFFDWRILHDVASGETL
jgi:hypothetical protein